MSSLSNDALESLAKLDPQQSRVVERRFFAGLSVEQAGGAWGVAGHRQPRFGDGPRVAPAVSEALSLSLAPELHPEFPRRRIYPKRSAAAECWASRSLVFPIWYAAAW